MVLKLRTANGVDHFLEACSREERDEWAADITAAADELKTHAGAKTEIQQQDAVVSQLNNINLR